MKDETDLSYDSQLEYFKMINAIVDKRRIEIRKRKIDSILNNIEYIEPTEEDFSILYT